MTVSVMSIEMTPRLGKISTADEKQHYQVGNEVGDVVSALFVRRLVEEDCEVQE